MRKTDRSSEKVEAHLRQEERALEGVIRRQFWGIVKAVLVACNPPWGYRCRVSFKGEYLGANFNGVTRRNVLKQIDLEVQEIANYVEEGADGVSPTGTS